MSFILSTLFLTTVIFLLSYNKLDDLLDDYILNLTVKYKTREFFEKKKSIKLKVFLISFCLIFIASGLSLLGLKALTIFFIGG